METKAERIVSSVEKGKVKTSNLIKPILIVAGALFVGLAILGIFLSVLPTTPFLLLMAACYARSSQRFSFLYIASTRNYY